MKKIEHEIQTEYLDCIYGTKYQQLVPSTVKHLRQLRKKYPFDTIAFSGSSGAALAFPVSYLLKVRLIHIRKRDGSHYSSGKLEGTISSQRYLIVDDVMETGATIRKIIGTINKAYAHPATTVGIYLYDQPYWDKRRHFLYKGNKVPMFYLSTNQLPQ